MSTGEAQPSYTPSSEAVALLCERLQRMGVSMSESAARTLLEAVLAIEGARLDALTRGTLQASLEAIRKAAEAGLVALTGSLPESRRDYELSFPPASEPVNVSGKRRKLSPPPRPPAPPQDYDDPVSGNDEEPRPVFKRRRDR
jgi:hypothetical protein